MKQANSTEIDRLLQRHARRWNAAASSGRSEESVGASGVGASDAGAGAHLDADEMSAYAEGALPSAAHARYMAHLADCDSCRKIVTDLMLTGEAKAEQAASNAVREVVPSKSLWSVIAALFAPPVMRYAMPALLLVGIIVVALVATRNRKEDQMVALNEQKPAESAVRKEEAPPPAVQPTPGESVGANTSTPTTGTNQPTAQPSATPSDGLLAKNKDVAQTPPAPTTTSPAPSGAPATSPEQGRNLNDQLYENIPKAAPPPPPAEQSRAASKPVAKERPAEEMEAREQNEVDKSSRTETTDLARSKDEARDDAAAAGGRATGQAEAPQAGAKTTATRTRPAARRGEGAGADAKGDLGSSTETRSVEGRRFRRQGNAWVDTAYKSSRSTINVARGSDQYRALVADEPKIGRIADQLGGEVILIWMGKAYRIY